MSAYIKTLKDYEGNTVYPQTVGSAVGIEQEMFGSAAGTSTTEVLKKLAGVDVENKKIIDYQGNELEVGGDSVVYIDFEMGEPFEQEVPSNILYANYVTTDFDLKSIPSLILENKKFIARINFADGPIYLLNLVESYVESQAGEITFGAHRNFGTHQHLTFSLLCQYNDNTESYLFFVINDEPAESGAGVTLVRWEEA